MRHRSGQPSRAAWTLAVLACLVPFAPAAAEEEGSLLLVPLNSKLDALRDQIKNASLRFKNKVIGVESDTTGPDQPAAPQTPAAICCSHNLVNISVQIDELKGILDELNAHYGAVSRRPALAAVQTLRGDLAQVSGALAAFKNAGTRPLAQRAMDSLTQAFIRLRDSADTLAAPAEP